MLDYSKLKIFGGCLSPQCVVNKNTGKLMLTPCNKCVACLNTLASKQATRVRNEILKHKYTVMFTLTYSNVFLPKWEMIVDKNGIPQLRPIGRTEFMFDSCPLNYIDKKGELRFDYQEYMPQIEGIDDKTLFGSCCKKDIQNFMKRVRWNLSQLNISQDETKVRYYIASEYGPTTLRPHYHGLLFFDNEVIAREIKDVIVKSWGRFERGTGRRNNFAFRPFARVSNTADNIKMCDANGAFYVAEYIAGNLNLPKVLADRCTRPFHLGSRNPIIGSYKCSRETILRQVRKGTYRRDVQMYNEQTKQSELVSVPLDRDLCNSLFVKCKGYSQISYGTKLRIYFAYSERRAEWLAAAREAHCMWQYGKHNRLFLHQFIAKFRDWTYRRWYERTYPTEFYLLELDNDMNWYASRTAWKVGKEIDIGYFGNWTHPCSLYVELLDRYEVMKNSDVMTQFYTLFNDMVDEVGYKAAMCGAYPFGYPVHGKVDIFDDISFSQRYSNFVNTCFYENFVNQNLSKFQKRNKSKKIKNSYINGVRIIN